MTHRFYVYPLIFLVLLQLGPLLRQDARWHAAQLGQLALVLLAGAERAIRLLPAGVAKREPRPVPSMPVRPVWPVGVALVLLILVVLAAVGILGRMHADKVLAQRTNSLAAPTVSVAASNSDA